MRIQLASVYVDDQARALHFYSEILSFIKPAAHRSRSRHHRGV